MKNLFKTPLLIAFLATSMIFTSCSDDSGNDVFINDDEINDDEVTEEDYEIIVSPTNGDTDERTIEIATEPNTTVEVDVNYTGDKTMRRIYITKNVFDGEGPLPLELAIGDLKNDGSIDLGSDEKSNFEFTFDFDTPSNIDDVVQYVIWTTNAKGDFRDVSNSNSIADDAVGVVTIKGSETTVVNTSTEIKSFTAKILAAPLADGSSSTFLSVFNGEDYKIVQQENADVVNGTFTEAQQIENAELSALWDFGYFYTNGQGASFASAYNYMNAFTVNGESVVKITDFTGLSLADLNQFFFAESTLDFDTATNTEIDAISSPSSEEINNLEAGDVIEFVDTYGNKGLIRVNQVEGTFNAGDFIEFDVN